MHCEVDGGLPAVLDGLAELVAEVFQSLLLRQVGHEGVAEVVDVLRRHQLRDSRRHHHHEEREQQVGVLAEDQVGFLAEILESVTNKHTSSITYIKFCYENFFLSCSSITYTTFSTIIFVMKFFLVLFIYQIDQIFHNHFCSENLFLSCSSITYTKFCYDIFFLSCSSITYTKFCYENLFLFCSSITYTKFCYENLFLSCSSITYTKFCYENLFLSCSSITYTKFCYENLFLFCSSIRYTKFSTIILLRNYFPVLFSLGLNDLCYEFKTRN